MASNQLSDQDRNAIILGVDHLFGRALTHFPCPLQTMDERRDLHWCALDVNQLHALKEMASIREGIFSMRSGVHISVDDVDLFLNRDDSCDKDSYFWGAPVHVTESISICTVAGRVHKAAELFTWLQHTSALGDDLAHADESFMELMKMCTTAGQVRRVLPELVDFMPTSVKLILGGQRRASSTPFEWSAYDRDKVEHLTNTMAKCMLLVQNASTPHRWSERNNYTWPTIASLVKDEG